MVLDECWGISAISDGGAVMACGTGKTDVGFWYYQSLNTRLTLVLVPSIALVKQIRSDWLSQIQKKVVTFQLCSSKDTSKKDLDFAKKGQMSDVDFGFLKEAIEINELNRINGHIEKLIFVKGDANKTIPKFVKENPWLLVSLLYIDFDLYEPTITVLKHLLPLVPKGGVVAFDELAKKRWEGETAAFKELLDANKIKLQRFSFEPGISYFIMGE